MWYVIIAIVIIGIVWFLMKGKKSGSGGMQPPMQPPMQQPPQM